MFVILDVKAYSQVADALYDFQTIIPKLFNFEHKNGTLHAEISLRAKHMENILHSTRKKSTTS